MKILSILIGLVLVGSGSWYLLNRDVSGSNQNIATSTGENGAKVPEVVVEKVDVAQTGSKLPAGFPSSIPVEVINVIESYKAVYAERGVTQYTVSYTSVKGRDALWDVYNSYMKGAGYVVDTTSSSRSGGQIIGTLDEEDTLSVILSNRSGATLVQISLIDRQ